MKFAMTLPRSAGLFLSVLLPPLVFVMAGTSSLSTGTAIASLLLLAAFPATLQRTLHRNGVQVALVVATILALLTHLISVGTFQPINLTRGAGSLLLLLVLLTGAQALANTFFAGPSAAINRASWRMFIALTAILVVGILDLVPSEMFGRNKVIFPFSEPSHFALAYAPFLLYAALQADGRTRTAIVLGAFAMGYLVHNLTLMLASGMVATICMRARLLLPIAGVLIASAFVLDLSYFTARLEVGADSENLSSLVYLQGWQLMGESLVRSNFLGLGFQQLGERPTEVVAATIISQLSGLELNLSDGGFLCAKIVSEFGLVGALIVALLSIAAISSALKLRGYSTLAGRADRPGNLLAECLVATSLLEIFIRGTGYFSGTTLLLVAAYLHLFSRKVTLPRELASTHEFAQ